jgi:phosphate-selective porin OprO/OprP
MKNAFALIVVAGLALPAVAAEPVSRDEVRSMVSEMMADAETRSSLLQGGATAGYDKNFFLASADNKYRLNVSGYTQFRYTARVADNDNTLNGGGVGTGSDFGHGFNIRRTVLAFSGNAGSESLKYSVRLISKNGDSIVNDDAFVAYELGGGWGLKAGQYKVGFLKEELNSDSATMAADRGFVNSFFSQGRSQAVSLYYLSDNFDGTFDFSDGARGEGRKTFGSGSDTVSTSALVADWAVTGRGEFRFAGTRAQLRDYTSRQDEKYAGNVGAAFHLQGQANNAQGVTGTDTTLLGYTVDAQIEGGGFGAFLAFVGTHSEVSGASTTDKIKRDDFGFVAQGNYRVLPDADLFAKYELIMLDGDRNIQKNYQFVTFGANHYFAGNAAKLTVDCVFSLNHTDGLVGTTLIGGGFDGNTLGLTGTNSGGEMALRAQVQVMF